MDTLKELENYCNIKQPVGALMLTGEWGCGKTYLLNEELIKSLKKTHVFFAYKSIWSYINRRSEGRSTEKMVE